MAHVYELSMGFAAYIFAIRKMLLVHCRAVKRLQLLSLIL